MSFYFGDMFFGGFTIIFMFFFIFISSMIIYTFVKGIKQNNYNNQQPILSVEAIVIAKRTKVSGHEHTRTSYYVTFEVESKDRIELEVQGIEYGQLIENDKGKLTFQGTRYKGFAREKTF
ncbi:DUF2500 domain-containing protein [Clostridium grantii]|uniref:DUF2500 domain-containing protein n=1 Tax=Clostridium grantii DSM 8605 TaxID=1121316 RepID=A0A1M5X4X9_9CLOT|nr:DUF2500 domain-containing protein [Clostridium grantii]SHH94895.1 Protein of unknown function [Clostridium grantii DSM 8605]